MRKMLRWTGRALACQFVGVSISALCSGCATTGYLGDRMRDAGDVFTASVGMGAGAKARVGPLQVGAIGNIDMWGLRGGKFGDVAFYETLTRDFLLPWPIQGCFGEERFVYEAPREMPNKRGKGFLAKAPLPVLGLTDQPEYYTQVEVVIAIGGSLRLGFNPGELLDFVIGWTTIDIYGDDLNTKGANPGSDGIHQPADGPLKPSM
jgi:hypothetical protein